MLQETFSLNVNLVQNVTFAWNGPDMFPTQRNSQKGFVVISALLRAIWGILRHSGGNIQRCLSLPVSTKINAVLTVAFLKHCPKVLWR